MTRRPQRVWFRSCAMAAAAVMSFPPAYGEEQPAAAAKGVLADNSQPPKSILPQPNSAQQHGPAAHVELERLRPLKNKAASGKPVPNAFNPTSWYVPPPRPPAPPPPPPPAPVAPPLPFTYLGRYQDAQKLVVMLASGNKLYTVSQGEVMDGTYRVDRITDGTVDLVYLPLNINQSIAIGVPDNGQRRLGAEERDRRP